MDDSVVSGTQLIVYFMVVTINESNYNTTYIICI